MSEVRAVGWGRVRYVPTWLRLLCVRGEGGGLGEGKICAYLADTGLGEGKICAYLTDTPLCQR